ncbi:MAG: hypothetical protein FWG69_05185 [Oscillospiraceae bacterium]|nr:hypothetical protein [Oscillospiraceae bacterium]
MSDLLNNAEGKLTTDNESEILVQKPEKIPRIKLPDIPKKQKDEKERKADATAFFGIFLIIFAAIGMIAAVFFASGLVYRFANRTELKNNLEEYLAPIVMNDPPPFEDASKIDNTSLIIYSIWNLVLNTDPSVKNYDRDSFTIFVPAADVDMHAADLFGDSIKIEHQSVYQSDFTVEYFGDEEQNYYAVAISLQSISYTPRITAIKQEKNIYTLRVAYIQPGAVWGANLENGNPRDDIYKELEYVVERSGRNKHKLLQINVIPTSEGSVSQIDTDEEMEELQIEESSEEDGTYTYSATES